MPESYDILKHAALPAVIVSRDGDILWANGLALSQFKLKQNDAGDYSQPTFAILPDPQGLLRGLESTGHTSLETFLSLKSRPIPVEIAASYIKHDGKPAILCIIHDIFIRKQVEETLIDSERRCRAIIDGAQEGIFRIAPHGRVLLANPSLAKILGAPSPHALMEKESLGLFFSPPETFEAFLKKLDTDRTVTDFRASVHSSEGEERIISMNARALADSKGNFFCAEGFVHDITEALEARASILRRMHLETMISKLSRRFVNPEDGDVSRVIMDALRQTAEFLEIDRCSLFHPSENGQELVQTHEWHTKDFKPVCKGACAVPLADIRWWQSVLADGERIALPTLDDLPPEAENERQWLAKRGARSAAAVPMFTKRRWAGCIVFESSQAGIDWQDCDLGMFEALADTFINAQESRRIAEKLERSEERNRTIVETMREGLITTAADLTVTYVNRRICEMLGRARDEILGRSILDFLDDTNQQIMHEEHEKRQMGSSESYELRWRDKNGREVFSVVSPTPLFSEDAEFEGSFAVVSDVTGRRKLESQLLQAQKLEAIGQLAAGIAHELNTPAQYVGDNLRFIRESFDDLTNVLTLWQDVSRACASGDEQTRNTVGKKLVTAMEEADMEYLLEEIPTAITQTLEGVDRIATIVHSMKKFAHPGESGAASTDINDALRNSVIVATNEWKQFATVEFNLSDDTPNVVCIAAEVNQVFLNLVVNAAQAIEDKVSGSAEMGTITVSTALVDDGAEIRIRDTGTGMPEEIRQRVFDPFFTTKEVGRGTGQGLAIAHGIIVDKHGGTISVESTLGEGTEFTVWLPPGRD